MMKFDLKKSVEILSRTPRVLEVSLAGLSDEWIHANEGDNTWSPYDIVGHLIHGEKTDWIPRVQIILSDRADKTFETFDRKAQFEDSKGKSLRQLLDEFKSLRRKGIEILESKPLTVQDLLKTGVHPAFGNVSLAQLLSTWTAHDLGHLAQIARVMARQYKYEVGPWIEYLPVLTK
jgi:uncharacterized damage-inducible protein DinB